MRINRFVFLDLSTLSLEDHLGVTVSPQSPLSAGYITPSAGEGSLPPGLMPAAARAAPFPRCFRLPYSSPFCCDMGNGYFNRALDPLQHNGLRAHLCSTQRRPGTSTCREGCSKCLSAVLEAPDIFHVRRRGQLAEKFLSVHNLFLRQFQILLRGAHSRQCQLPSVRIIQAQIASPGCDPMNFPWNLDSRQFITMEPKGSL